VKDMASVAADEPIVNKVRHKRSKVQPHSRDNSTRSQIRSHQTPDINRLLTPHANSVVILMNLRGNFAQL